MAQKEALMKMMQASAEKFGAPDESHFRALDDGRLERFALRRGLVGDGNARRQSKTDKF